MNQGQTVFSHIIDFLPQKKFRQCVNRYNGNYRVHSFTCYNQFLCMAFAQLTYRESLIIPLFLNLCLKTWFQLHYMVCEGTRG